MDEVRRDIEGQRRRVCDALDAAGISYVCDEPLSKHTSFQVGGAASYFLTLRREPLRTAGGRVDRERVMEGPDGTAGPSHGQLRCSLDIAEREGLPYCMIGNGSNIIASDHGYPGLILHLGTGYDEIRPMDMGEGDGASWLCLRVGAGLPLAALSAYAADHALTGLEFASGIPGTVGGAVVMNAGAYGGEMADIVERAELWMDGDVRELTREEMRFGYRDSILRHEEGYVLSVTVRLQRGEKSDILKTVARLRQQRKEKQPLDYPSAGSTFKRPAGAYAGALIEAAGLRGFSYGGAAVSEKHCGFLINRGGATAAQVYHLLREVQRKVKTASGIDLEPEVVLLGQFEDI